MLVAWGPITCLPKLISAHDHSHFGHAHDVSELNQVSDLFGLTVDMDLNLFGLCLN